MKIGTKSLLFGAHYPVHMICVAYAWHWLYGEWFRATRMRMVRAALEWALENTTQKGLGERA